MRLNGADNFWDGYAQLCERVGVYPKAHRVLTGAEYLNVADTRRTEDGVCEIDIRVVRQEIGVVGPMWRVNCHQQKRSSNGLSNRDSVVGDVERKLRSGLRFTGLSENEVGVRISFYVKVHNQASSRVAGRVQRIHVIHVVDAIHLLLDGSGN